MARRPQPHIGHLPSLVRTNSRTARGGRQARLVVETRVPVSASSTARATSTGSVRNRPATTWAGTQASPGRKVPDTEHPGTTAAMVVSRGSWARSIAAPPHGSSTDGTPTAVKLLRTSGSRSPMRTVSPVR